MIIKKITLVCVVIITTLFALSVYATGDGFYIGMMLGQGNTNLPPQTVTFTNEEPGGTVQYTQTDVPASTSTSLAGRFFLGINFNKNVATELGFVHYPNTTFSAKNLTACFIDPNNPQNGCIAPDPNPEITMKEPQIHEYGVDLLLKGMIPIGQFGVFAKGGLAYIRQSAAGSLTTTSPDGKSNAINNFVGPELALGVYYDLTPNWEVDFSASRVFHGDSPADMYALGFSYHFVTLYCGQFIC